MSINIQINHVTKKVKSQNKSILNDVNLSISDETFIALVGPSGAGKTTLLNALSGYDKNFEGDIFYNQYSIKEQDLRREIAYVPQREILHKDLTLYQELWYIAKIRLKGLKNNTIKNRINETIKSLDLNGKERTMIRDLSGGEKRRLSIAIELMFRPKVLILDEPTSGLDLQIEKKLMQLLKKLSKEGTTIIMSAHTVSNLDLCDKIVFMGSEGKICYYGTYKDSFDYFHVKEFVSIYEIVTTKTDFYSKKYLKNYNLKDSFEKMRLRKQNGNFFREVYYLSKRYLEIILNDKFVLSIMLFQGLLIALFFNIAVPKDGLTQYDSAKLLLFATSCAAMWIGLFNSIQEIVKEKDILKREYMSNLNLNAYMLSKIIVLSFVGLVQSILFITTQFLHFDFPDSGLIFSNAYIEYVLHFFLINIATCALGLFISTLAKKQETTLVFALIYIMIQLIFSGILLSLKGLAEKISYFVIGRYAVSAMGITTNLIEVVKNTKLNGILNEQVSIQLFLEEAQNYYEYTVNHLLSTWGILIIMGFAFLLLAFFAIHKKVRNYN